MTLVSDAKIRARRTHSPPTMNAVYDQLVNGPITMIGTPARTAIWNAPPSVPPMKAEVLKNSALATLTSRTSPDDWRVNRVRPPEATREPSFTHGRRARRGPGLDPPAAIVHARRKRPMTILARMATEQPPEAKGETPDDASVIAGGGRPL